MPFDRALIEAKLSLGLIASADMPSIAWDALESGLDGPAIRRLAALERPTYFEVREILPRAMEELGLSLISRGEAAYQLAKQTAKNILESKDDPLKHMRDFESLWIRADYANEISSLGNMYDEIWIAEATGQSEEQIRKWVIERLKEFV